MFSHLHKVPWSKGYDTALSRLRCSVRVRRESFKAPWSNRKRTPASQAGDVGFKSRRSYCGCRTTVVRQIVVLHMRVRLPPVTPNKLVCVSERLMVPLC